MAEQLVPILKVADTSRAVLWYSRLGFVKEFEHRYSEEFPGYAGLLRGDVSLHLSEHPGDATPDTLLYFWVDDVDAVAKEFEAEVIEQDWAREVHLSDPDGNRLRVAARKV
jgi:predicted enzyme related to lactoylglutathione lyase